MAERLTAGRRPRNHLLEATLGVVLVGDLVGGLLDVAAGRTSLALLLFSLVVLTAVYALQRSSLSAWSRPLARPRPGEGVAVDVRAGR